METPGLHGAASGVCETAWLEFNRQRRMGPSHDDERFSILSVRDDRAPTALETGLLDQP